MLDILIADDEQKIRQGLRHILDWERLGYRIAGEAADGQEAVAFLTARNPHVVLLDLNMPKCTGLEVIERARAEGFTGKVIILSGYSDFKYAQEAIRLGVDSYLTKPIDEQQLVRFLEKLRRKIKEESRKQAAASNYYRRARETIVRDFFLNPAGVAYLDLVDMNTAPVQYQVVRYESDSVHSAHPPFSFQQFLRVANKENHQFDQISMDSGEAVLLKGEGVIRRFHALLDRYRGPEASYLPVSLESIFLTYGRPVQALADVHLSYEDAEQLRARKFFCPQNAHVMGYEQLPRFREPDQGPELPALDAYAQLILKQLQSFRRHQLSQTLSELGDSICRRTECRREAVYFLTDLYLQIKGQIIRCHPGITVPFPEGSWVMEYIQSRSYLHEILRFLSEQFELIMNCIGHDSKDSILDEMLRYIEDNYMHPLKLEQIAPLFGYNCSYLGKLFKQKIGKSFNRYLDELRIRQSKAMLAENQLKIYQVAERVGYSNVDYFSAKFKKQEGISPTAYRKHGKGA